MNKTFADYVTNTAFFLSISKKQIVYLQILYNFPYPHPEYYVKSCIVGDIHEPDSWISSYRALTRKGLVERIIDDVEICTGHYELTNAGKLVCELLKEAALLSVEERKVA